MKFFIAALLVSTSSNFVGAANDRRPTAQNELRKEAAAEGAGLEIEAKIVDGVEVDPKFKYEFMVNAGGCGASLVAPNVLLSAAHCAGFIDQVTIGRHDLNDPSEKFETFNVVEEVPHPDYNSFTYDYDYMMLRLDGSSSRTPVELDTGDVSLDRKKDSIVMGWGAIFSAGPSSSVLLETEVDLLSRQECQDLYGRDAGITSRMVCAARFGKDSCQGDSGGPIIDEATKKQIGVVSWGFGCADPRYPGVYAKVQDQIEWIQGYISKWSPVVPITPEPESAQIILNVEGVGVKGLKIKSVEIV